MPGTKYTSTPRGAMAAAANDKNERAVSAVLSGAPGYFARVEKNLGSYFKLIYHDGEALHDDIQGEPRGVFTARGKVRVKISAGDIVLLDGIQRLPEAKARGKKLIVEIVGRFSKKEAQLLYRSKRIHKKVYSEDGEDAVDDLFDYGEGEDGLSGSEEDEVDIQANIKRGKVIRARKVISTAEKSTGRGSGGAGGRGGAGGGRKDASALAKEQMDASAAAAGVRADSEDEEELEALADGLGVPKEPKEPKKKVSFTTPEKPKEPAAAPEAYQEQLEEKPFQMKSYDNWEDAADELDIDAI